MGGLRIAYVYHWPERAGGGIVKKALEQLGLWQELGAEAEMFALTPAGVAPSGFDQRKGLRFVCSAGRRQRFFRPGHLAREIMSWRPDVIYTRYTTWYPYLEQLSHKCPIVFEVNSDDRREYAVTASRMAQVFHAMTRGMLQRQGAGFVAVTPEIVERVLGDGRRSVVITNGIDLDRFTPCPPVRNPRPNLVFLGTPGTPWHGLDDVVALAGLRPQWTVNVVGSRKNDFPDLPDNVRCHGFLSAEAYRSILESSDVGIGSLALYRNHMSQACPLKTREYLAMGLPVIAGYRDVDFPGGADFLLEVPNRAGGIVERLDEIDRFVARWSGQRVPREAVGHLHASSKERARLDFLSEVAGG